MGKTHKLLFVIGIASVLISAGLLETTFKTYESFTELYFDDFRALPSVCYPGEERSFSFTAVSHEKRETDYSYDVKIRDQTYAGGFSLRDNESTTIPVRFKFDTHHFTKVIDEGRILNYTSLLPRRLYLKSNVSVVLNETYDAYGGYYVFVDNTISVIPRELRLANDTLIFTGDNDTVYEMNLTLTPRPIFTGDSAIPLDREGVFFVEYGGRIEKHTFKPFGLEAALPLRNNYVDWDPYYVPMSYVLDSGISGPVPLFAAADVLALGHGDGKYLLTSVDTSAYRGERKPMLQTFQNALIYFLSDGGEIAASSLGGLNSTRVLCYAQSNAEDCKMLKEISDVTTAVNLQPYDYEHSMLLEGLEPNTTYYLIVKSTDKNNRSGKSSQYTFTTLPKADAQPPALSDLRVVTSDTTAVITWKTDEPTTGVVRYGRDSGIYLKAKASAEYGEEHSITLTDLHPSTKYYYVVDVSDRFGNTFYSEEHTFYIRSWSDPIPPTISNVKTTTVKDESITITWRTNEPATSVVRYGKASGEYSSSATSSKHVTSHSITLTGLLPNATYYYVISSADPSGNTGATSEFTFITLAKKATPVISNVAVSQIIGTSAMITWDTLEASDSSVLYGTRPYAYDMEVNDESDISFLPTYDVFWIASGVRVSRSDLEKYAEEIKSYVAGGGNVWLSSPDNESWNSAWLPAEVQVAGRGLHAALPTKEAGILTASHKRQKLPTRYFGSGTLLGGPEGLGLNFTLSLEEMSVSIFPRTYLLERINVSVIDDPNPPFGEYAYEITGDSTSFYLEKEGVNVQLTEGGLFVDRDDSVYMYEPIKVQVNVTAHGKIYDIYFWTTSQKKIPIFYKVYKDVKTPYGSVTIYRRNSSGFSLEEINSTIQNPLGVQFSNKVELMGYNINKREIRPGEELEIAIYWRSLGKMLNNYTLTFDIRRPDFTPLMSVYSPPGAGGYETSMWDYYDIIVEEYTFPVPYAINGTYYIWTGIYGEERPILTSSGYNAVRITNVTVFS